jgi:hypothetical protein
VITFVTEYWYRGWYCFLVRKALAKRYHPWYQSSFCDIIPGFFFLQIFFFSKKCFLQIFFLKKKNFSSKKIFSHNFFSHNFFFLKIIFFHKNIFLKFFFSKTNFSPNWFSQQSFFLKIIFFHKYFFLKSFFLNIFFLKIFFFLNFFQKIILLPLAVKINIHILLVWCVCIPEWKRMCNANFGGQNPFLWSLYSWESTWRRSVLTH